LKLFVISAIGCIMFFSCSEQRPINIGITTAGWLFDQHTEGPLRHKVMSYKEAVAQAARLYKRLLLPDPDSIGYLLD
jgi:hypothetical protein